MDVDKIRVNKSVNCPRYGGLAAKVSRKEDVGEMYWVFVGLGLRLALGV